MDRKKIAIIFLILVGILFVVAISFSHSDDDSTDDADENYEAPSWVSSIQDMFGSNSDPLTVSHISVKSGDVTIDNDLITIKSTECTLKVKSSKKDLRSCYFILQEIPESNSSDDGRAQEAQQVEVQYTPKDSSDDDKKAEPPVLMLGDLSTVSMDVTTKGLSLHFEITQGSGDYSFKYSGIDKKNIEVVSGDVEVSSSRLSFSSADAEIKVTSSSSTGKTLELEMKSSDSDRLEVGVSYGTQSAILTKQQKDRTQIAAQEDGGTITLKLIKGSPSYVIQIK